MGMAVYLRDVALLAACLAIAGCDGRRTVTGDTSLTSVAVRVHAPPALAAFASALSWPADAVPGALVTASGAGAGSTLADTAVTDSAGVARFTLPFGTYKFDAVRTLTDTEQVVVGDALGGTDSFTGVVTAELGATATFDADVALAPVDRGALLFSEIFPSTLSNTSGSVLYYYGMYLKIYNNSDTTIALAGKLFIDAFPGVFDYTPTNNCSSFAGFMRDSAGIWARLIYRFPANARVLEPGETAVLATDAIDHRSFGGGAPGFLDLSGADFEFRGASDVDNPLVPDMVSVGLQDGGLDGHGWFNVQFRPVLVLAMPLEPDTLPRQSIAGWGLVPLVRIPVASLLDVVTSEFTNSRSATPCPSSVVPAIDASEARLLSYGGFVSMHRKVSRVLSNGRVILQRTHKSAADWKIGPQSPFGVP